MNTDNKKSLTQLLIERSQDPEFIKENEESWRNHKFEIPTSIKRYLEQRQKMMDQLNPPWLEDLRQQRERISSMMRPHLEQMESLRAIRGRCSTSDSITRVSELSDNQAFDFTKNIAKTFNNSTLGSFSRATEILNSSAWDSAKDYTSMFNNETLFKLSDTFQKINEPLGTASNSFWSDYRSTANFSGTMSESASIISAKNFHTEMSQYMHEQMTSIRLMVSPNDEYTSGFLSAVIEENQALGQYFEDFDAEDFEFEDFADEVEQVKEGEKILTFQQILIFLLLTAPGAINEMLDLVDRFSTEPVQESSANIESLQQIEILNINNPEINIQIHNSINEDSTNDCSCECIPDDE